MDLSLSVEKLHQYAAPSKKGRLESFVSFHSIPFECVATQMTAITQCWKSGGKSM